MKINTKDLISGGLLVLLALVGLWLNTEHTLGDARRMGPGYMPMLVFVLLLALGAMIVLVSLRSGPDALERWTNTDLTTVLVGTAAGLVVWQVLERMGVGEGNWRQIGFAFVVGLGIMAASPGWRPLALVSVSMAVFALALEPLGLVVALVLSLTVSAFADSSHTVRGVLGMLVALIVMAWAIFIWQLDIRVPVWPTAF